MRSIPPPPCGLLTPAEWRISPAVLRALGGITPLAGPMKLPHLPRRMRPGAGHGLPQRGGAWTVDGTGPTGPAAIDDRPDSTGVIAYGAGVAGGICNR
jgi:hypothetical protein